MKNATPISAEERRRREDAVKFARVSVGLEGFKPDKADDELSRQYVAGEISISDAIKAVHRTLAHQENHKHMPRLDYTLKHSFSCLEDCRYQIEIDDDKKIITIAGPVFDSSLIAGFVTRILPEDNGVVAFRDDADWPNNHAPYRLRIRIDGCPEFDAEAVRLASIGDRPSEVSITLRPRLVAA